MIGPVLKQVWSVVMHVLNNFGGMCHKPQQLTTWAHLLLLKSSMIEHCEYSVLFYTLQFGIIGRKCK